MFNETGEVKYSKEHAERKGGKQEIETREQSIIRVGGSKGYGDECTKSLNFNFIVAYGHASLGEERSFLLVPSTWN
jgi:hypothetical protein